jgi:hypothetical protein
MGLFKISKHKDEMGKMWKVYTPTVYYAGAVEIKGKDAFFTKKLKK